MKFIIDRLEKLIKSNNVNIEIESHNFISLIP